MLDDAQQRLLLRLTPSAFDDDRASWGSVLAQTYALRGDSREGAGVRRLGPAGIRAAAAGDAPRRAAPRLLGLALAYLGQKAAAIREGKRGVALLPISRDASNGPYLQHQLARIYILVGEPEKALDQLEPLLKIPYYLSPGWLKIDPNFDPLRGNPRFERLVREVAMSALPSALRRGPARPLPLERELGRGGMATVYLAHDLQHDRPVALKVLHPELAATLGPERFLREIRTTARLQHPTSCRSSTPGEAAGQLWYTMPYVEGESLRDRLRREAQLPLEDALRHRPRGGRRAGLRPPRTAWCTATSSPRTSC